MDEPAPAWRPPPVWRALLWLSRFLCAGVCRLRVTGDVPEGRRQGPLLLAANHIGAFDPVVLSAACARIGVAPRIMATGGLFRAPVFGGLMRRSGHVRVDRREAHVVDALETGRAALGERSVLLAYPEGRITLDPGMWPERGKTGLARLAMETGTPVVPVAQWGAHLVLPWGAPRGMLRRIGWSVLHRPVVRVHFGPPVDLTDLAGLSPVVPAAPAGASAPTLPARSMAAAPAVADATSAWPDQPAHAMGGNSGSAGDAAARDPDQAAHGMMADSDTDGDAALGDLGQADVGGDSDTDGDAALGDLGQAVDGAGTDAGSVVSPAAVARLRATGNGRLAVGVASAKAVRLATDRIIEALAVELEPLRPGELRLPAWVDPARPISAARTYQRRPL